MFLFLMTSPSWMNSEARDLLRLGGARPPVSYAVQEGLARHHELAASGAPLPSWANRLGTVAKSAGWITVSAVAAAMGATVVLLARPGTQAPSCPAPEKKTVAPSQTALTETRTPFASAWRPLATPALLPTAPSVPVEALPLAAPIATAPAATTRGAGDSARDARRLGAGAPDLSERVQMPAPRQPEPRPASSDPASDELLELQEVAQAERVLAVDPARALALVHAAEARFPRGYVREERGYVEIMALVALGSLDEARPKIARFLRDHPDSAFSQRVREASRLAHLEP